MKTILLLAFTVLVSSVPMEKSDKKLLGELIDELSIEVKILSENNEENEIYLAELQMHNCKGVFFCQAEQELLKKVSGRSGAKFDRFRTDKKLMRNLQKYNQHHGKTCKPADEDQEITLLDFLKNLLTCARIAYGGLPNPHLQYFCEVTEKNFSMKRIPENISETTSPAELDDKLNMKSKNVTKEPKKKKILPEYVKCNITLPKELDELDMSMKNVSKKQEEKILPKGAISNKTFQGELELDKVMKNVSKESEEKKILLKDVVCDKIPLENSNKKILGELIDELDSEVKHLSEDNETIYLTEVKMNNCKSVFFCQAEQELIKKVSGRSGAKFDRFRTDKKLMRNLHMYNQRHVETCKNAHEDQEMTLLDFLKNLLTCAKYIDKSSKINL